VHLLEERREIVGLGYGGQLAELDEAAVVCGERLVEGRSGRPISGAERAGLGTEDLVDEREKLELLTDDTRALLVGLETRDGELVARCFGCLGHGGRRHSTFAH